MTKLEVKKILKYTYGDIEFQEDSHNEHWKCFDWKKDNIYYTVFYYSDNTLLSKSYTPLHIYASTEYYRSTNSIGHIKKLQFDKEMKDILNER